LQTPVGKDLLDHRLCLHRRDDLQVPNILIAKYL